jgi:hypothetical protein
MLSKTPKTKPELIKSLQHSRIDQFVIKDTVTKPNTQNIKKELDAFIGSSNKPVSIIFLKGS